MNVGLKCVRAHRYLFHRGVVLLLFFGLLPAVGSHARSVETGLEAQAGEGSSPPQKLVGTAVTSDPLFSLAIVEDQGNRRQRFFHEGDRAGHIIIRKILPNYLLIEVDGNERVVKMGHYLLSESKAPPASENHLPAAITDRTGDRDRYRVIDRARAAAALSDIREVMDSVDISAGRFFNRVTGIRIASFGPGSIFSEMGLRSGDLLLSVNGREIGGPEEAPAFFNQVIQGGDLELTVRRRARSYRIRLQIQ